MPDGKIFPLSAD